nr:reverse transcriptase domain-containing protein [Tanacetum cinerariifolium]
MLNYLLRGRLLASFQDLEHEGGDTRSQGGIKDNDIKIKIQDHNMQMITQRNSQEHKAPSLMKISYLNDHPLGGDCEPSSLFDFEEVINNNHNQEPPPQNNNGPPLMVIPNGQAPRMMEGLCQPSINGWGRPIAPIPIQATDFGLRHYMIQQVQNTYQFHGLPGDDANRHIDKFLEITQHMKQNGVFDDALVTQIDTFYNGLTLSHRDTINAAAGRTLMQKTPEECYELIKNMTAHHNHWDTSAIRDETSRNISSTSTTESPEVVRQLEMMNKIFLEMMRQFQMVKTIDTKCETCGGPHSFIECPAVGGYTQETTYATTAGPSVSPSPPLSKEVDQEPKMIMDQVLTESTNNVPPLVVQPSPASTSSTPISFPKMPEVTKDRVQLQRGGEGETEGPAKVTPLQVVIAIRSSRGLGTVLLGSKPVPEEEARKHSLPELTAMQMILELVDRLTTRPAGIAEDIFVKKERRPFLRTGRAFIDVYGEELTLRVDDEAITFKVAQTSKYSYNDAESINRIDVIDVACEDLWVRPVHYVPKKGGMTVVENKDNELIPTRVTGWRVCIDYQKLNDATQKDHFPLPFMDQMLERLARNEFYCFLDGFSG